MKPIFQRISTLILLFALMGGSCKKENKLFWEISPDGNTAVIQKEVEGIEFKFYLLNEMGVPATVFNENENFAFNFSFANKLQNAIAVTTEFINPDFFRVYRSSVKMILVNHGRGCGAITV